MNQKERLINTLRKGSIDRHPFICPGGMMTMVVTEVMDETGCFWPEAHRDAEKMTDLAIGACRLTGIENLGVPFCMTVEAEAMGAVVDIGSKENEPRIIAYAIDSIADLDRLSPLDVNKGRAKVCIDAIKIMNRKKTGIPVIANLVGPMSLATSLIEPLVFYRAMKKEKEAANNLVEISTQNLIRFGDAMLDAGADVICIADPGATGELIGRDLFAEFELPYLNRMADHFRNRFGVPVIVHICGKVRSLGETLSDIAADAVSVDSVVSIDTLKEQTKDKILMGNISTFLLERGEVDSVFKAGRGCIKSGVHILAPACGISPKTPAENVRSLSKAVLK